MALLGELDMEHFEGAMLIWPLVARVVLMLYLTMMVLVMLNMLIAKMGTTYDCIANRSELEWVLERARLLNSIENEMGPEERARTRKLYYVMDQGEACFQVLVFATSALLMIEARGGGCKGEIFAQQIRDVHVMNTPLMEQLALLNLHGHPVRILFCQSSLGSLVVG